MSLTITTDVFCDRCSWWCPNNTVTGPRTDARRARKRAKLNGWHIQRGMDLCPDCTKITDGPEEPTP